MVKIQSILLLQIMLLAGCLCEITAQSYPPEGLVVLENEKSSIANCVAVYKDGFVVGGAIENEDINSDFCYLARISFSGEINWEIGLDNEDTYRDQVDDIVIVEDVIYIVGEKDSRTFIAAHEPENGKELWQYTFESHISHVNTLCHSADNHLVCAGSMDEDEENYKEKAVMVAKFKLTGEIVWQYSFGNDFGQENTYAIKNGKDNDYLISASSYGGGNAEVKSGAYLLKVSSEGQLLENINLNPLGKSGADIIFGGSYENKTMSVPFDMLSYDEEYWMVVGGNLSGEPLVTFIDGSGRLSGSSIFKELREKGSSRFKKALLTKDGGILLMASLGIMVKLDAEGNQLWEIDLQNINSEDVAEDDEGNLVVVGYNTKDGSLYENWTNNVAYYVLNEKGEVLDK